MKNVFLILLFVVSITSNAYSGEREINHCQPKPGILIEQIEDISPGTEVKYCEIDKNSGESMSVYVNNVVYDNAHVIPFDVEFTPSKLYLIITSENEGSLIDSLNKKMSLSKSLFEDFPDHRLADDASYLYCEFMNELERTESDGMTEFDNSLKCFQDYLNERKNGKRKDSALWKIAQITNYVYEIEEFAEIALREASGYEEFLNNNPENKHAEEAKETIARLYRIAFECMKYGGNDSSNYSEDDAISAYNRAYEIYADLSNSDNSHIREKAIVSMFNMKNNRSTYVIKDGNYDW